MFGKRITLFKLLGFEIRIDLSWFIIFILIIWTLAKGIFPQSYQGLSPATYWWMGLGGALGLFASIIFHELCHSLVSRRYGLPMKGITLFIFGGVAEMGEEPSTAKIEFFMAIAGPLSSIFVSWGLRGILGLEAIRGWPEAVKGVIAYLAYLNLLLAGFNMIPAFPLDGGRVLRSILWKIKGNIKWATRVASRIGTGFGIALIIIGVLQFLMGNIIGGIWLFLIGMFLRGASQMSYQQLLIRRVFEGEPVKRFMETNPVTVSPSLSVKQLVEDYIYTYHFKMFPVVDNGKLVGCVGTREVKEVPQGEWARRTVGEMGKQCSPNNTIGPEEDAVKALSNMNQNRNSRLMVVDGDRLVGIVSLKDMLKFLSLKMELEE